MTTFLISLESGKYDIGTKGAWYRRTRQEFIIQKIQSDSKYHQVYRTKRRCE